MLRRSIMIAALMLLATPAAAGWTLPCIFGGCSITFVSPEYAAKPVQPLDPEAALAQINAYRTKNGRKPVVLDERLSRAAAAQSKAQAGRSRIGHDGSDGSKPISAFIVRRSRGRGALVATFCHGRRSFLQFCET
mgnify:CR=1 FL=1